MTEYALYLTSVLAIIGLWGTLLHRNHFFRLIVSLELLFVSLSSRLLVIACVSASLDGQILVLFLLAIMAFELALWLILLWSLYRQEGSVHLHLSRLRQ